MPWVLHFELAENILLFGYYSLNSTFKQLYLIVGCRSFFLFLLKIGIGREEGSGVLSEGVWQVSSALKQQRERNTLTGGSSTLKITIYQQINAQSSPETFVSYLFWEGFWLNIFYFFFINFNSFTVVIYSNALNRAYIRTSNYVICTHEITQIFSFPTDFHSKRNGHEKCLVYIILHFSWKTILCLCYNANHISGSREPLWWESGQC